MFFSWQLFFSASIYSLPLLFPDYMWWMAFCLFMPFFVYVMQHCVTFVEGYMWGCITFIMLLGGILDGMFWMAHGSCWLRFIPLLILVVLEAFFAAIWFWLSEWMIHLTHHARVPLLRLCVWTITTWIYLGYMQTICLWPFARMEGCFLYNPLVLLAYDPPILSLVGTIGSHGATLLVLICSAIAAGVFVTRSWWLCGLYIMCVLVWMGRSVPPDSMATSRMARYHWCYSANIFSARRFDGHCY